MPGSAAINFFFELLWRHRAKHLGALILGLLLVALVGSVLFLTEAARRDLQSTLDGQADLVVQRMRAGKAVDLPVAWADGLGEIPGVAAALPRVHGRYFHEPGGTYFTVVGVDPFDRQATAALDSLVAGLDLRQFLAGDSMVVGPAVLEFLRANRYEGEYVFKTPTAENVPVHISGQLPAAANLIGGSLVVMEIDLARRVLGVAPHLATDLVLLVPNELEWDSVMAKAIGQHYDIRVIQKRELAEAYANLFNYRGGAFLLGAILVLLAFCLVLYQRYGLVTGAERREIGLLRTVGWSIRQVIALKMAENLAVALTAYLAGVVLAYTYVFLLGAPLLAGAFFGFGNLPQQVEAGPVVAPGQLVLLFLFFMVPFLVSVLVPVWKLAVTDPAEVLS
jgi:putative ABC transport system permease protein